MKRKLFISLLGSLFLCVSVVLLGGGCSEGKTGTDYASEVVTLYGDYSNKFDEISQALAKSQRVTVTSLCDEALDILDQISEIEPPVAFKDEHKIILECCKNEKEKINLAKEYVDLAKDEGNLTDEQNKRVEEITERLSQLSIESDNFYNEVEKIAGKVLATQTQAVNDGNLVGDF